MNKELLALCTIDTIKKVLYGYKYKFYTEPYKINIVVIRNDNKRAGTFDDIECLIYNDGIKDIIKSYPVTSDPSDISLINTKNDLGCAILKCGQYIDMWTLGYHKGREDHPALVQISPCTVIRDFNKDKVLDFDTVVEYDRKDIIRTSNGYISKYYKGGILLLIEETGVFGINNHRASMYAELNEVGLYSQGCVVHSSPTLYVDFINTLTKYNKYNKRYTCTLINKKDLLNTLDDNSSIDTRLRTINISNNNNNKL